jgi:hypothetical protein
LEIALQEAGVNAGVRTTVASGADFGSAAFTGTYGDFTLTIFGGAAANGANLSSLLSAAVSVTNNSGTAKTLQIWVSETNYTLPAGTPLRVEAGAAGTINTGTVTMAGIFQPWGDKNNNLFGTADQREGMRAFLEKRSPAWKNR